MTDSARPVLQNDHGGRPLLFSLFMTSIETLHFVIPDAFESIVPRWVPHPRFWVFASGVAEMMALDAGRPGTVADAAVWVRLPFQFPMFAWALRQARARPSVRQTLLPA